MTDYQSHFLSEFACLGDACEDTCCKGWGMQLSEQTVQKYRDEAPELLDAVTSGEAEYIMKRDAHTDYCIKYDAGWCGIHADKGTDFLGDACHFFPRITRKVGDAHYQTASLSCPEVVRLALFQPEGVAWKQTEFPRLPHSLKDYNLEVLNAEKTMAIHQHFIELAGNTDHSPEHALCLIRSVVGSMVNVDPESWAIAVPFYMNNAASGLPHAEGNVADPFNLLNALQGLVGAAPKSNRDRLMQTIKAMESALHVTLDWERLSIHTQEDSLAAFEQMQSHWQTQWRRDFDEVLRRWLQTQLTMMLFPFAGLGQTMEDRATLLGVRFATVKLALMSACEVAGSSIEEPHAVRIIQSLSRFLDHLADPTLSMQIYAETGWTRLPRLRALVGDY